MSKKILVTGSTGFLGGTLLAYLRQRVKTKTEVIGVDRFRGGAFDKDFFVFDLLRKKMLIDFLRRTRPAWIFHCAGGKMKDLRLNFEVNVATTYNLLDAVLGIPKYSPRIIIVGSAAEYGANPRKFLTEGSLGVPSGGYGQAKLVQTQTALYYAQRGLDVVVGRIFNIIGPGVPPITAPGYFARKIVLREKGFEKGDIITGRLNIIRDFIDVRDVCSALYALAMKGRPGEIYNICSQRPIVLRDLLHQMGRYSAEKWIRFKETKKASDGVPRAVGSNAKIRQETGWRAHHNLEDSLKAMLDSYRIMKKGRLCASS